MVSGGCRRQWMDIESVLTEMSLHLKASDQAGIWGKAIFDPVGTNDYIKSSLIARGWKANIGIPSPYRFLGTDVDFGNESTLVEAQFSNYPFLLNNILRSEFFFKSRIALASRPVELAIIITKAHMFPASNSTLYYEQGEQQLNGLATFEVFDVPIRLVGLFDGRDEQIPCIWTEYENPRYSRTVVSREDRTCILRSGTQRNSRCIVHLPS